MKLFVAGATGVLGTRTVPQLVRAGHAVTAIARTPDKASAMRAAGATPVTVDLFDPGAITAAVAGHDGVVNLATHIPDVSKAARNSAWAENDRIRTEGARNLVDAAIAAKASRYVQESISFFYVDGGIDWVHEDSLIDAPEFTAAFQTAEGHALRFTESGGTGVVLRFAMFYGAGSSHTTFQLKTAKRGISPFPGPKDGYQSFLHLDDAATAVVAALGVPSGIYNVSEDQPATRRELAEAVGEALGRRPGLAVPGITKLGGAKTSYMARSLRVSNRKFRDVSGWTPAYPEPKAGWRQVVTQVGGTRNR
jgi:nucleoside-diphosphate-sugar epimerase